MVGPFDTTAHESFPTAAGTPNPKGLDFYKRLVDELRTAGVEPFVALYHWDLPQTLQDKYQGWVSKQTAKTFAAYAARRTERRRWAPVSLQTSLPHHNLKAQLLEQGIR